jgi:hypothetical protein
MIVCVDIGIDVSKLPYLICGDGAIDYKIEVPNPTGFLRHEVIMTNFAF